MSPSTEYGKPSSRDVQDFAYSLYASYTTTPSSGHFLREASIWMTAARKMFYADFKNHWREVSPGGQEKVGHSKK